MANAWEELETALKLSPEEITAKAPGEALGECQRFVDELNCMENICKVSKRCASLLIAMAAREAYSKEDARLVLSLRNQFTELGRRHKTSAKMSLEKLKDLYQDTMALEQALMLKVAP